MRGLVGIACVAAFLPVPGARGDGPSKKVEAGITSARAEALVREVSATVEQLRRLRFETAVAVEVVDGATARMDFESGLDDAARESAGRTRDAWVRLGLVPPKTDLVSAQLDLAEKDLLGIGKAKEEAARTSQARAKAVEGAPTFLQMRLLLPYTLGFSFLLRGKPWEWLYDGVRIEDIELAYARPPHSTREILHPEQYWGSSGE